MKNILTLSVLLICLLPSSNAQKLIYELPESAAKLFHLKNYSKALELYRDLYKNDLTNTNNAFHFGVCLIYTFNYDDGIKLLEQISKKPETPDEVWYHLAKGYHATLRFDKSIDYFKKYIKSKPTNANYVIDANRTIQMCLNAIELVKEPVNVSFENLGKNINSKGKDFLPVITDQESYLIFTTRREGTTGKIYDLEGHYTADIYTSKFKSTAWSKAIAMGYPNSYGNEQTAGISENGSTIFYYINNPMSKSNLQIAEKSKSTFKKSELIKDKNINSKSSDQISATITNDQNLIIYSSNTTGGIGGFDLYLSRKLPNGTWGGPENLSSTINTEYNENYPYLTDNGKTLYFASEGHNSIGGYDIFKSIYNEESNVWSKPENIGYPLNTPLDDYSICFTQDKKSAYIASYRNDSYGDYDIYKVTFNNENTHLTTIKGYILNQDSVIHTKPLRMEVFNLNDGNLQGIYESNTKGNYLMILPPGNYKLIADIPNQQEFIQHFDVKDRKYFKPEINQNIRINFTVVDNHN